MICKIEVCSCWGPLIRSVDGACRCFSIITLWSECWWILSGAYDNFNGCKCCLVSTVSNILLLLWYVKEEMGSSHSNLPDFWLKDCRDITSSDTAQEPCETQTLSWERVGHKTASSPSPWILQIALLLAPLSYEGHHKPVLWKHHNIDRIPVIKYHLSYVETFLIQFSFLTDLFSQFD